MLTNVTQSIQIGQWRNLKNLSIFKCSFQFITENLNQSIHHLFYSCKLKKKKPDELNYSCCWNQEQCTEVNLYHK